MKHNNPSPYQIAPVSAVLLWAVVLAAVPCLGASNHMGGASDPAIRSTRDSGPSLWMEHGRLTFGIQFSYGLENNIPHDISHINMVIVEPQVGIIAWDAPRSRLPVRRLAVISEGILGSAYRPGGSLLGMALLLRLGLKPQGRVVPFVDLGSGPLRTTLNQNAPEVTGHVQFLSRGGFGMQYYLKPQEALIFEYRYFHMSNGGLQEPNPGFNGSIVSVGICWQREPKLLVAARVPHAVFSFFRNW